MARHFLLSPRPKRNHTLLFAQPEAFQTTVCPPHLGMVTRALISDTEIFYLSVSASQSCPVLALLEHPGQCLCQAPPQANQIRNPGLRLGNHYFREYTSKHNFLRVSNTQPGLQASFNSYTVLDRFSRI
jgi:hypothetical protein